MKDEKKNTTIYGSTPKTLLKNTPNPPVPPATKCIGTIKES